MEIFTCLIQIVALEFLVLMEVFFAFKLFFIFRKRITLPDQQKIRNREYSKISAISLVVEIIGTFSSIVLFQREISNNILFAFILIVFFRVLTISFIHREVYVKRLVENDVNKPIFHYNDIVSDGYKAIFISELTVFTIENYIYMMQISLLTAIVLLSLSVFVYILLIPRLYRFVENRPYPELNLNRKFKWLD